MAAEGLAEPAESAGEGTLEAAPVGLALPSRQSAVTLQVAERAQRYRAVTVAGADTSAFTFWQTVSNFGCTRVFQKRFGQAVVCLRML